MKKLLSKILLSSFLFAGSFNVEVGLWNMSWKQNDKPSDSKITTPIENNFNINNSLAKEFSIYGRYEDVKMSISYTEMKKNSYYDKTDKFMKYSGYLGYDFEKVESYFRYIFSKTDGVAEGIDPDTLNSSYVSFSTELKIYDLIFYPKFKNFPDYFGIGYRNINYTLPQSLYVIGGNSVVGKMVDPKMEWNANYITLSINNSKNILDKLSKNQKIGYSYFVNLMYGYAFNVKAKSSVADKAGYSSYIKNPKGDFFETEIGYLAFLKIYGKILDFKIGYRYTKQTLETDKSDVYIYAKANSEFKGLFATIGFAF